MSPLMITRTPRSTLFPYTTLFRSARRVGAQQTAVSIEHHLRQFEIGAGRHRPERYDIGRTQRRDHHNCCGETDRDSALSRHRADTSILLVAVRPNRSGRYMSSTTACGRTYLPGVTA